MEVVLAGRGHHGVRDQWLGADDAEHTFEVQDAGVQRVGLPRRESPPAIRILEKLLHRREPEVAVGGHARAAAGRERGGRQHQRPGRVCGEDDGLYCTHFGAGVCGYHAVQNWLVKRRILRAGIATVAVSSCINRLFCLEYARHECCGLVNPGHAASKCG